MESREKWVGSSLQLAILRKQHATAVMLTEYTEVCSIRLRFIRASRFGDFHYFPLDIFIKQTAPKILVAFFTLIYFAAAIGFSAVNHY